MLIWHSFHLPIHTHRQFSNVYVLFRPLHHYSRSISGCVWQQALRGLGQGWDRMWTVTSFWPPATGCMNLDCWYYNCQLDMSATFITTITPFQFLSVFFSLFLSYTLENTHSHTHTATHTHTQWQTARAPPFSRWCPALTISLLDDNHRLGCHKI